MKSMIFSSYTTDHSARRHPPLVAAPIRHHCISETTADEHINNARCLIDRWKVDAGELKRLSSLFLTNREEAMKLLEATIGLQHSMNYYVKLSTNSQKLVGAHDLMQIAMKRLQFEFYKILSTNRYNLDSEAFSGRSGVSISEFLYREGTTRALTGPPPHASEAGRAVEDLKSVAQCMIVCGYGKECVSIYRIVRKSIIDETLYHLGIDRILNARLKKMEWAILEKRIMRWLDAVKIAVRTLLYREKLICHAVFSSSAKIAEACFAGISSDAAADLFAFAESVCKCKKILSPDKLFRLLDLYEAISDLRPDIEFIFSDKTTAAVVSQAAAAQLKLAETVRAILVKFEKAIRKDSSQPTPGGGVHPLARYVMNFLVFLGDYAVAVSNIVEDWPVKARIPPSKYDNEADKSTAEISRLLSWLILVLLCKIDGKAAAFSDVALSYLFLANNLNYVVSKVRNSSLRLLVGRDWIRKHDLKVKSYLANYERIGWSNIISVMPENLATLTEPSSKVKECLERFYVAFQEACKKQSSWIIPDPKIRESVKLSLAKRIRTGYEVLYKQSRIAGVIVSCAPEDLYKYLSVLFTAASSK